MKHQKIKVVVITGYGINCEKELGLSCQLAGGDVSYIHAQQLFTSLFPWNDAQLIVFPGGFSFGDELGAAKVFANRITYDKANLRDRLQQFFNQGNCIMGICNGFQLLVKLGLLPGKDTFNQTVSLSSNSSNRFECRWVHHKVNDSKCVFTKGIDTLYLPVRHGEGNFTGPSPIINSLFHNKQVVLQYADKEGSVSAVFPENPNGSTESIGGICDPSGRIFGMMAHPEAALHFTNHPQWTRIKERLLRAGKPIPEYGPGFAIFKNVVRYLKDSK